MANRKKETNPLINERLNTLLAENNVSGRWICRNVLVKDDVAYNSSNFSRFTTGKSQPPDWIIDKLALHFNVRIEWLKGIDNFKTVADFNRSNVEAFAEQIISFAQDDKKVDKLARLIGLGEIADTLMEIYGVPESWAELPPEHGLMLINYLDQQLEHAFEIFFEYVAPIKKANGEDQAISSALSGCSFLIGEIISGITNTVPKDKKISELRELFNDEQRSSMKEAAQRSLREKTSSK